MIHGTGLHVELEPLHYLAIIAGTIWYAVTYIIMMDAMADGEDEKSGDSQDNKNGNQTKNK